MDREEVRRMLEAISEEIRDGQGKVLGYAAQPARFKIDRPYLARGGFLLVDRDEATGCFVATEFDSLPHPRTGQPYPAGHSERAWKAASIDEALTRVMQYFPEV